MAIGSQDIGLLFGVLGGGSISGESGQLIKSQLDSIVNSLNNATNSNQRRIRLNLDVQNTKTAFTQGLKQITGGLSGQKQFKLRVSQIDASAAVADFRKQLESMLKSLKIDTGFNVTVGANGATEAIKEISSGAQQAVLALAEVEAKLKEIGVTNQSVTSSYKRIKTELGGESATGESADAVTALKTKYNELLVSVENLRANKNRATQEDIDNIYRLQSEMEKLLSLTREQINAANTDTTSQDEEKIASLKQIVTLYSQINTYLVNNPKMAGTEQHKSLLSMKAVLGDAVNEAKRLGDEFEGIDKPRFDNLQTQFVGIKSEMREAGKEGKTLGGVISGAYQKFGGWMLVTRSFAAIIRQLKQMVTNVIEVDTAMTELKKVTDETDATYSRFLDNASVRAKEIGATLTDTINATADFARLGYSIADASTLADAALVYKNVGDGIADISAASESIISTMKAFGIEASSAIAIVDKFNAVGNNFAISSAGVGDALIRSASSLAFANNSLEESIALITAMNATIQDTDRVGTTLKTVTMFLRAAKVEAEEAGISVEGMANSVSSLRESILTLTGNKVDIMLDDTTFKSTYQIMKDISDVWHEMLDVDQAALLELLGGKRNSNAVASLIENFATAEDVLKTAAESAGSALAENEKYLDSIAGKLAIFTATFQEMSVGLIDSDFAKGIVDLGTSVLSLINNLGGLPNIIMLIIGALVLLKQASIASLLSSTKEANTLIGSFVKLRDSVMALIPGTNAYKAAQAAANTQMAIGRVLAQGLLGVLGLLVMAYSLVKMGVDAHNRTLEENRLKAEEAGAAYNSAAQDIDEYKSKISELKGSLDSGNLSQEEGYEVRQKLIAIQDEIIEKYGLESNALNLLKQSADDANESLDGLTKTMALNNLASQSTQIAEAIEKMESINTWLSLSQSGVGIRVWSDSSEALAAIEAVIEKYDELSLGGVVGNGDNAQWLTIDIRANAEDAQRVLTELYGDLSNVSKGFNIGDDWVSGIESRLDTAQETINKWKEIYDNQIVWKIAVDDDLSGIMASAQKARDAFAGAIASGDEASLSEAFEQFQNAYQSFLDLDISDTGVANYFQRFFDSLNELTSDYTFELELDAKLKDDGSGFTQQIRDAIAAFENESGQVDVSQVLSVGLDYEAKGSVAKHRGKPSVQEEAYVALKTAADAYGVSVEELLYKLAKLGEIQPVGAHAINSLSIFGEALKALWNSEAFENTKSSLLELAKSADGLTADNVIELAKESKELQDILDKPGMSAKFFASIVQATADGKDGFAYLTDEALVLNGLLSDMENGFYRAGNAATEFSKRLSGISEYDSTFRSYSEALEVITEQFENGTVGSKTFWEAASFLLGDGAMSMSVEDIYSQLSALKNLFGDEESSGLGFLERLYELSQSGELDECAASIEKVYDAYGNWTGAYDWNIDTVDISVVAEKMGVTEEAIYACIDALRMFGNVNLYDLASVSAQLREMGILTTDLDSDLSAVNLQDLIAQLEMCGRSASEIQSFVNDLKNSGVIVFDFESNAESMLSQLRELNLITEDIETGEITIDATKLVETLGKIGATKEQVEGILKNLETNGEITLLNLGTDGLQAALDALNETSLVDLQQSLSTTETNEQAATEQADELAESLSSVNAVDLSDVQSAISTIKSNCNTAKIASDNLRTALEKIKPTYTTTVRINQVGNAEINGTAHARGTALSQGTAYESGDWGAKEDTVALGGEVAPEMHVDSATGTWRIIGSRGAEFFRVKKGDIIFNGKQTRQLLSQGFTDSRGKAYLTGTAYASGTSGRWSPNFTNVVGSNYSGSVSSSASDSADSFKEEAENWLKYYRHIKALELMTDVEYYKAVSELNDKYYKGREEYIDDYRSLLEELFTLSRTISEDWLSDREHEIFLLEKQRGTELKQVELYKQMQEELHQLAEDARAYGLDENSDYIQELQKQWWGYQDAVREVLDSILTSANESLDNIQNVYDVLKGAAREFAENHYITVDTFQSIANLGVQYLAYLVDENGQLAINEESIKKVVAAKTQQVAVETALNYIRALNEASIGKDVVALNNLLYATEAAGNSTWDLVYAQLAMLDLDGQQYQAALARINALRSLADTAVTSIGKINGTLSDSLKAQEQALGDLLKYVIELIKWEVNQQVDGLKEQVAQYRKIVDLQKESLSLAKEKDEIEKVVTKKIKSIADLQARINQLALDDSREAQAEKKKLETELAELQEDLANYQADYAHDAQVEALDKMADAYEEEKNQEIEILEKSISSQEKLYRLAIERISTQWDTLYQDLINWNYEAGSSLESELVSAWNTASEAVQRYGGYLEAVMQTQNQLAAISNGSYNTIGSTGDYDSGSGATKEQISSIVSQMKANSAAWFSSTEAKRNELDSVNSSLAAQVASLIGQSVVRGDDGVWYIGGVGNKRLYEYYHTGTMSVGSTPTLKDNEVMAVLEKKEGVLDEQKKDSVYELVDFATVLSEKLGKSIDMSKFNTFPIPTNHILPALSSLQSVKESTSMFTFSPEISVKIEHTGNLDDESAGNYGKVIAESALSELASAFNMRGIGRVGSAALKQQ